MGPALFYLGRSRFGKDQANLIQTLHSVAGLEANGHAVRLVLPAWKAKLDAHDAIRRTGVQRPLEVLGHAGWRERENFAPYPRRHRAELRASRVFCRYHRQAIALLEAGVGCTLEVHNFGLLESAGTLTPLLEAHAAGRLRALVCINRLDAEAFVRLGADPSRVFVAPSGVDPQAYAHLPPPRYGAAEGPPRVVWAGRVSNDRGLQILLGLHERNAIRLRLVGDTSDPIPPLPGLEIEGFQDPARVPGLYARCDLVLLPYQPGLAHAGSISPIKLFEAMAAGRPIFASDLPTLRELLDEGRNGRLLPADDLGAWERAIADAVAHPDKTRAMAEAARAEAPRYAWTARARTLALSLGLPEHRPQGPAVALAHWLQSTAFEPRLHHRLQREIGHLLGSAADAGLVLPPGADPLAAVDVQASGRVSWRSNALRKAPAARFGAVRAAAPAALAFATALASWGPVGRSGRLRLAQSLLQQWPTDPRGAARLRQTLLKAC